MTVPAQPIGSARRSPPTVRTMRVLEAIAAAPARPPSLSTLARSLDLSPATCLGILNELVEHGYVERSADLVYRCGPALVALGQAASQARPAHGLVREAVHALAHATGLVCNASTVVREQIVVTDVAAPSRSSASPVRAGSRFPFRAPSGLTYAIWNRDEHVEVWLENALFDLPEKVVLHAWEVVRACRDAGHLTRRLTPTEMALHEMLAGTSVGSASDELATVLSHAVTPFTQTECIDLDGAANARVDVATVSVPVFNGRAEAEHVLTAHVMKRGERRADLRATVAAVRAAAAALTAELGGRSPYDEPALAEERWGPSVAPVAG